ncbi:MAG: tRNA pseudouridine(38-40) synthase TruA [Methanomassiliicoccaceae archaeon]|jgi:tRNA pseudouridine38-40 synthase|nr:tRNA pseudouridine(38-40) synthase TruA [Methanomassiliicoccaceae archaeon]
MRRVAVKIAYLGEGFAGSQIQPDVRTVEGEVLSNLIMLTGLSEEDIDLRCASRTDRGVNALGNVVVFNITFDDDLVLLKALNAVSRGVFYRSVADVDRSFNPRHANERVYRYVLPPKGIDVALAERCAGLFEGEHDFVRFCKTDGKPTMMHMRSVKLRKNDDILVIEFRSEYFLWNLIRRIVAAISSVGRGDASLGDVERALNGENISFGIARPDALTLMDVVYDRIEFMAPAADMFDDRIEEELFSSSLKAAFFSSL